MLKKLNSTTSMIDIASYRILARALFDFYIEVRMCEIGSFNLSFLQDCAPYKSMTANFHMLVSHVPDWAEYVLIQLDLFVAA
jgi:hypothetical protein